MKVLGCPKQAEQPSTDSEDNLVKFDIEYLVECLARLRKTAFEIVDRPDIGERNLPQPDYLIKDKQTGGFIAIEHARFFESQERRKSEATQVKESDLYCGLVHFPTTKELGKRLSEFFDEKINKRQFSGFTNCERILLARNRWLGIKINKFLEAEHYFKPQRRSDCDHFYLIVARQLLEVS
jgi:hypothetical protein